MMTEKNKENEIIEVSEDVDNIQEFIEQNMTDDPIFEKILIESEVKPKAMPSCLTMGEFIDKKILESYENNDSRIFEIDQLIDELTQERDSILEKFRIEYGKKYLPNYRRELRKWYFRNHKQVIGNGLSREERPEGYEEYSE